MIKLFNILKLALLVLITFRTVISMGMDAVVPVPAFFELQNQCNMRLIDALKERNSQKILEALQMGADPAALVVLQDGTRKYNACMWAVNNNDLSSMKEFLKHKSVTAQVLNDAKTQPLFLAIQKGNPEMVKLLLDTTLIDVSSQQPEGYNTPLGAALRYHDFYVTKCLLDYIPNINELKDSKGFIQYLGFYSPHDEKVAVEQQKKPRDFLQLLLSKGYSLDLQDEEGNSQLSKLVRYYGERSLMGKDFLRTAQLPFLTGFEALMAREKQATEHHFYSYITELLEMGADVGAVNQKGETPFSLAAIVGAGALVEKLICRADSHTLDKLNLEAIIANIRKNLSWPNNCSGFEGGLGLMKEESCKVFIELWRKNKSKNPVQIMRRYLTLIRMFSKKAPKDIVHLIAQYAITGTGKDYKIIPEQFKEQLPANF